VDTNTQGHRQWFFFSISNKSMSNTVRGSPQAQSNIFRFNIYRFGKKRSLYRRGMLPYTFSKRQFH
jgi:hypothetical protein